MQMRNLGESGLFVSELCFGAMTFGGTDGLWGKVGRLDQEDADALVKVALDAGINLFDTANVYARGRSEEILGRSLRNLGVSRRDVVIATKVASAMGDGPNHRGASRGHIISECRASLGRLGVDYIDLYQIHAFDSATPIEETLEALDTLVRAGDVRYIGLSNWAAWQVMKAIGITRARALAPVMRGSTARATARLREQARGEGRPRALRVDPGAVLDPGGSEGFRDPSSPAADPRDGARAKHRDGRG